MIEENYLGDQVSVERIMHTASSFAKNSLPYLQEIGTSKYLKPHCSSRGRQQSFLLCIVTSGEGCLTYLESDYELKEGDCFFINCSNPYTLSSTNHLWTLKWVHCQGFTMGTIQEKFVERCGAPCFSSNNLSLLVSKHTSLYKLASSLDYVKDMLISQELIGIIATFMQQCWKQGRSSIAQKTKRSVLPIREYIEAEFQDPSLSLDVLAEMFGYNKSYLTRRFKEEYGITVNQFILQKRINMSKHLLRFSQLSLSEISATSGFNDPNYFSRTFKLLEEMTPSKFRKTWTSKV